MIPLTDPQRDFASRHYVYAVSVARSFTRDDMGESVAGEAVCKAARTYDPSRGAAERSHVYTVVVCALLDYFAAQRPFGHGPPMEDVQSREDLMPEFLAGLSPAARRIAEKFFFEKVNVARISDELGMKPAAVRRIIREVRAIALRDYGTGGTAGGGVDGSCPRGH